MAEPPVFTKSYDFVLWLFPRTQGFPKTYRPSLAAPLQQASVELLVAIAGARFGADRTGALRQADASVETLRVLLRLAKDLRLVAPKHYLDGAGRLDELGRMVGGWSKKNPSAGSRATGLAPLDAGKGVTSRTPKGAG